LQQACISPAVPCRRRPSATRFGTQSGAVTISYTDGSTQTATLTLADWSATIPLESGKTVASVTLPVNVDMHIFAIATG
jgi:hypothetical protein